MSVHIDLGHIYIVLPVETKLDSTQKLYEMKNWLVECKRTRQEIYTKISKAFRLPITCAQLFDDLVESEWECLEALRL